MDRSVDPGCLFMINLLLLTSYLLLPPSFFPLPVSCPKKAGRLVGVRQDKVCREAGQRVERICWYFCLAVCTSCGWAGFTGYQPCCCIW